MEANRDQKAARNEFRELVLVVFLTALLIVATL